MLRIHHKLDSETLHLPELKPLIGRTVEITVKEKPPTCVELSRQQHPKPRLLEMMIRCECIGQLPLLHHHERDAISEGPVLVRAIGVKSKAALK